MIVALASVRSEVGVFAVSQTWADELIIDGFQATVFDLACSDATG
ncbi:hypothetical protein ABZ793_33670 [Micromonospora sp. NPDC047465]